MTLKDGYRFGGFSGTPPSEPNLSTPSPPGFQCIKSLKMGLCEEQNSLKSDYNLNSDIPDNNYCSMNNYSFSCEHKKILNLALIVYQSTGVVDNFGRKQNNGTVKAPVFGTLNSAISNFQT